MIMKKYSIKPKERITELKFISKNGKENLVKKLTYNLKIKPWPFGMPSSAMPLVVAIGVSPGDSPRDEDKNSRTHRTAGCPPSFGEPAGDKRLGFYYKDKKYYWDKVRFLCWQMLKEFDSTISEIDAISVSGHLNLGTGRNGKASELAIENDIVWWISYLLRSVFQPRIVILFGLKKILELKRVSNLWNHKDGLQIDWQKPHYHYPLTSQSYKYRIWNVQNSVFDNMLVVLWPNHPSRPPFAGSADNPKWSKSINEFKVIVKNNFSKIYQNL